MSYGWILLQEELAMYDRHVGFSSDTDLDDPQSDKSEGKLRRRDTPHHLKNKRICNTISKDDAEEKVRAILAATTQQAPQNKGSTTLLLQVGRGAGRPRF